MPKFITSSDSTNIKVLTRNIESLAKYSRNMSILNEESFSILIDLEKNILYCGTLLKDNLINNNSNKISDSNTNNNNSLINHKIKKNIPSGTLIGEFNNYNNFYNNINTNYFIISFYKNGQCDPFSLIIENKSGVKVFIQSDPISAKIKTEYMQ